MFRAGRCGSSRLLSFLWLDWNTLPPFDFRATCVSASAGPSRDSCRYPPTRGGLITSCSRSTWWESLRSRTLLSSKAFEETLGKTKCLWRAPVPFQEHRCSSPFGFRHSPRRLSVECSSHQFDLRLLVSVCLPTHAPLRIVHKDLSRTQSVPLLRLVTCLSAIFPPHRWSFIPKSLVVFQLGWVVQGVGLTSLLTQRRHRKSSVPRKKQI